MESEEKIS